MGQNYKKELDYANKKTRKQQKDEFFFQSVRRVRTQVRTCSDESPICQDNMKSISIERNNKEWLRRF